MARAVARRAPFIAVGALVAACSTGTEELPPYGEAIVVVDTDLPVPQIANRLRVDLYDERGTWFESREIARPDPRDWPASFGVYSTDDGRPHEVMVRLRVYPEGSVRDYGGERFEARPDDGGTPHVAATLAEACARAPLLGFGDRLTVRAGPDVITDHRETARCKRPARAGAAIARVEINTAGVYRFDVAGSTPYEAYTTLSLRRACDDPATQIACDSEPLDFGAAAGSAHFPRFEAELAPGTYFLVADGTFARWPIDVALEASPVDTPLPPRSKPPVTPAPPTPRLLDLRDPAQDRTPKTEPLPTATVDRLLRVRLEPGRRGRASVTLRASCAGTMARLGADPRVPDPSTATTCIDREATRVALDVTPLSSDLSRLGPSVQGSSANLEPCDAAASTDTRACIPGGVFVLGSQLVTAASGTISDATPERIAIMSRFWLDRDEVTVRRFRAAVDAGFAIDEDRIATNEGPFPAPSELAPDKPFPAKRFCTYSLAPQGREDMPVSCISWELARAFCQREGGDLPTEAQWEYAATAAGRPFETLYPWGDDIPTCDRAVYFNVPQSLTSVGCGRDTAGPMPVARARGFAGGDVTPNGVGALTGNVSELTRDGGYGFGEPCWKAASLVDPQCVDAHAPRRTLRGTSWLSYARVAVARVFVPSAAAALAEIAPGLTQPSPDVGFRCAYGSPR